MPLLDALPSKATVPLLAGSVVLLLFLNYYLNYRRLLNSIQNHPGFRNVLRIHGIVANILPPITGVAIGGNWAMRLKHKAFAEAGWDVLASVGKFPRPTVSFILADPLAIKEMTSSRARFPKPVQDYTLLSFFGKNIVITEGEEWKKHRKIAAPAFSEKNNKLVWEETARIMVGLFENWGIDKQEVVVNHCVDVTLPIALFVIGVAGFGRPVSWTEDEHVPKGHQLSFKDALHTLSSNIQVKLIAPNWVYPFSKFLRRLQLAFDELGLYMQEMIDARRNSEVKVERNDLFSALLDGSQEEKGEAKLSDQEVIGNIFVFLLAGHETTAHTLTFCFGLLALEQDEQEKLYQHIKSVVPNGETLGYEHINTLTYSMAVFNETLRLFPPVNHIPKIAAEDTTISAIKPDGTRGVVPVPKGSRLYINTPGLHFNPRYWPDPETFNPSRFLGDWPRDAFMPFSAGPRACVGRRFFETEGIAVLTMLVSKYKIELKNPELYDGLTYAEKRKKLLAHRPGLTVTPVSVPLVFKKR